MNKDRAYLLAHPEMALPATALKKLNSQVDRRTRHEPLAHIRGKTEFYGREFLINKHVLEPRPESEAMIELLKKLTSTPRHIADVGTGSGCLAITAKLEIPEADVVAIDIDEKCLDVARKNALKHDTNIKFLQGDLLGPLLSTVYSLPPTLLCNLPYVPDSFTINQAAMNEPRHAIFGGPDGLDLYRRLFAQTAKLSQKPKYILTESLPLQHKELSKIAESANYKLQKTEDFIQFFNLQS